MSLTLSALKTLYSEHILIKISDANLNQAESESQSYSNQTGKNYAYINSIVRNCWINWMKENLDLEKEEINTNIPENWEFVNGSSVTLKNQKRLIFIPSDVDSLDELIIPQEWVDIPSWAGDYYLPVRIDLEKKYLHIWGYVSRKTLKAKAEYNGTFRNYYLDADYLINEVDLLWIGCDICQEKGEVKSLPPLSRPVELIEQLSEASNYSPRLKLKFDEWGALLDQRNYLQKLYEVRLQSGKVIPKIYRQISEWLTSVFTENWQSYEEFVKQEQAILAFRNVPLDQGKAAASDPIERKVKELYQKQDQIALPSNLLTEEAVVYLLQNTSNQTILWESADYLQKINPNHPSNAIRRVMDLGLQLMGNPVALIVAVLPQIQQKVAVLLRVSPMGDRLVLPTGISLVCLDENGNKIPNLEAVSREHDACIQLYFTADSGDRFGVSVGLQTAKIAEFFEI